MINISKEIRMMLLQKDVSQAEFANMLGISAQNLSNKLRLNNFRFKEVEAICNLLDYDFEVHFIPRQSKKA